MSIAEAQLNPGTTTNKLIANMFDLWIDQRVGGNVDQLPRDLLQFSWFKWVVVGV